MTLSPLPLPPSDDSSSWSDWLTARVRDELGAARELVGTLRTSPPEDAVAVLRAWDRATGRLGGVAEIGSLLGNVHPDESVRDLADDAEQEAQRLSTEWSLDRELYEVFAGLDDTAFADDPAAARLLGKVRKDFRRSGVDQDDETRERISKIRDRLTELDQEFSKITRDDVRTIRVEPERLAGLPADWLEAHPAGDDGLVPVTTDYPDAIPVRMFALDQDVRREIQTAFLQRGWPDAEPLLEEMFALRQELATLVGYNDWASYDADVKMIGTGPAIRSSSTRSLQRRRARWRPTSPSSSSATARTTPTRPRSRSTTRSSTRSGCARSATRSTRRRCAPTSPSRRCGRACSRSPGGSSVCATSRPRRRCGTRRWPSTTSTAPTPATRWAASTSTCTRARASTSTPRSSPSSPESRTSSCPRACSCATSPEV